MFDQRHAIRLVYQEPTDTRQFRYLEDNLDGYALVMVYYPEIQMPEAYIRRTGLMETIREYEAEDDAREARAKERKSKARM